MTWVDFQTVRENLDVHEVLAHYGFEVKQNGQDQVKIHCPFHDDKNPSCGLNTKKRVFNCFSCGEKGNILDFVARMEGFDPDTPRELRKAALFAVETFGIDGGSRDGKSVDQPKAKATTQKARNGQNRPARGANPATGPDPSTEVETPPQSEPAAQEAQPINPPLTFELKLETDHPFLSDRKVLIATEN